MPRICSGFVIDKSLIIIFLIAFLTTKEPGAILIQEIIMQI